MKRITPPAFNEADVYSTCVGGITDLALKGRMTAAAALVSAQAALFLQRASAKNLHLFTAAAHANGEQLIVSNLTKEELMSLYTNQMSSAAGSGRDYYDKLKLTPSGICPLCGFGHVTTLDHYAAKARYPAFSVLPINLIPACYDCNKIKGAGVMTQGAAVPHPYFEGPHIENEKWLNCSIRQEFPISVNFEAQPPTNWTADAKLRVENHFGELNLGPRLAIEAGRHLASAIKYLRKLTPDGVRMHLEIKASSLEDEPNHWESALYHCLFRSEWFIRHGYLGTPALAERMA